MSVPVLHAVLFDFDGTLAPNLDLPDMRRQVIALTRSAAVPERVFADCYIVEVIDAAVAWLQGRDAQAAQAYCQAAHQLILDIELEAAQSTEPFPGIADKLDALRATGKRLGVVTRNCRDAVLQALDRDAADTAMVGDGALDMQAGRELNMFCVGVLSGSTNARALQAAGADQIIAHCLDLDL